LGRNASSSPTTWLKDIHDKPYQIRKAMYFTAPMDYKTKVFA
jgi:hypothetical protein